MFRLQRSSKTQSCEMGRLGRFVAMIIWASEDWLPFIFRSSSWARTNLKMDLTLGPMSSGHKPAFGDDEDDLTVGLLLAHDLIAGFPDEIGNINPRERICAAHLQLVANGNTLEGLPRLQGGQGAFEAREIKQGHSHGRSMVKDLRQVN